VGSEGENGEQISRCALYVYRSLTQEVNGLPFVHQCKFDN